MCSGRGIATRESEDGGDGMDRGDDMVLCRIRAAVLPLNMPLGGKWSLVVSAFFSDRLHLFAGEAAGVGERGLGRVYLSVGLLESTWRRLRGDRESG